MALANHRYRSVMAPAMRFPQGLKRLAVNLAGGRTLGLTGDKVETAKGVRGRSDFEYRARAVFRAPAVFLLARRRMMRIFVAHFPTLPISFSDPIPSSSST